jgi:hypothetical protein
VILMNDQQIEDTAGISSHGLIQVETTAIGPLTRDLLVWLDRTPRTYAETMEAWRSTCPRLTIWEDALADGLVRIDGGNGTRMSEAPVVLTPRGRATLG